MLIFCDWLTIYQKHHFDLPVISDGVVKAVDGDGVLVFESKRKLHHKGSFDSSIHISCDGNTVYLSGNVGRWNRQDNLFGYSVQECVLIANQILKNFNLPPFTNGKLVPISKSKENYVDLKKGSKPTFKNLDMRIQSDSDAGFIHDGACITRVDLTVNYFSGSAQNASNVIVNLQGFKMGKFEPKSYFNVGVSWGETSQGKGSKWVYAKMYNKASDYIRHHSKDTKFFDPKLFDFMLTNGLVRHEITLKSRYLKQNNLNQIKSWELGMENKIYALFDDPLRATSHVDSFLEIPGRAGELAVAWRDGADLKTRLSPRTFRRYRAQLLEFGIDISVPVNVSRLKIRVEVIELRPVAVPDWYHLPKLVG